MASARNPGWASRPDNPIGAVEEARRAASRARAEWLYAVATGVVTPLDAIRSAIADDGSPLRGTSLRTVLEASCSRRQVDSTISKLERTLGVRLSGKRVPVRWLAYGARLEVLVAILEGEGELPERFPFEPLGRRRETEFAF